MYKLHMAQISVNSRACIV